MSEYAFNAGVFGALIAVLGTCALTLIVGLSRELSRCRYHRGWRR